MPASSPRSSTPCSTSSPAKARRHSQDHRSNSTSCRRRWNRPARTWWSCGTALRKDLSSEIQDGRVALEPDARGLVVSIQESGSFTTGSADLPPAAQQLIAHVADRLRNIPNAIRVEGHTDDVPIQTSKYSSNWDLSTARATRVVDYLIHAGEIDPVRLSAAGYSEFRPLVPNDSPANRARNRRTDIVILNTATRKAEEPARR